MLIPFGEWLPDQPTHQNPGALEALGVIAAEGSYRPLPAFQTQGNAMTARVQGALSCRGIGGSIGNFAGDATKLYKWDGTDWDDVSRLVGGAYATGAEGFWQLTQFGDLVVAVNGVDAPQKFTIASSTNFEALGGSPPTAALVTTVRDFVVMGQISGARHRVQWSGRNNAETWSSSQTTQADQQNMPDGGDVMALVGGEYGIVFQERSIKRMSYEGVPTIWRFDEIARGMGTPASLAVATWEGLTFFLSNDGFFVLVEGSQLIDIGHGKVDRYFWNDVDPAYLYRITATIDPFNKLYIVSYPGAGNSGGTPNKLLIYNWATKRWSRGEQELEMLHIAATQSGYTLDQLDSVSSSLDALPFSLDSRAWAGSGKLLLSGFGTTHKIGFFDGAPVAATLDTSEAALAPGRVSFLRSLRPIIDTTSATVRIGKRNRVGDAVSFTGQHSIDALGKVNLRATARYHRARFEIAAGTSWTHAQGVDDLDFVPQGRR